MSERRIACPEFDCGLRLRPDEMVAHLERDHNWSKRRATEAVEDFRDT